MWPINCSFMEPIVSFPWSHEPDSWPYPKSAEPCLQVHFDIILPGCPSGIFCSRFPTKILYEFLISSNTQLDLHFCVTGIIYGKELNLWSSSLYRILNFSISPFNHVDMFSLARFSRRLLLVLSPRYCNT